MGEALLDVVAASGSRHGRVSVRAGGTAVSAAIAAAWAGADSATVARVGADAAGEAVRDALRSAGVDPLLAVDRDLPTGCYVRLGDEVVVDRGASAALTPEDVAAAAGADVVLVSGYTLDRARPALTLGATWTAVDLARPDQDAEARVAFASDVDVRELARFEYAVVKLGADGAVAAHAGRVVRTAAPAINASLPLVGAGDAFDAGFLVALAQDGELESALAAGTESARLWIERHA